MNIDLMKLKEYGLQYAVSPATMALVDEVDHLLQSCVASEQNDIRQDVCSNICSFVDDLVERVEGDIATSFDEGHAEGYADAKNAIISIIEGIYHA